MNDGPDYCVWEQDLANQIGVSVRALVALRAQHLHQGQDWARVRKRILLTESAAQAMAGMCAAPGPANEQAAPAIFMPPAPQIPVRTTPLPPLPQVIDVIHMDKQQIHEGVVVRCNFPNTRVILVSNGKPDPFIVRVSDNKNFIPGMKVRWREVPGQNAKLLVGRCPRYKGKW